MREVTIEVTIKVGDSTEERGIGNALVDHFKAINNRIKWGDAIANITALLVVTPSPGIENQNPVIGG